ncbi:2-amino-4-hydroxy-6-hydroxymethyldihydropteridine diphosphokinase [Spirosoma terrae]|uniref:2-amino-4-hydroxy-6-hydroxymethyldihydropteridine pyrophosphokinase n=1 Tax=Spirosoma terrae TaxID=1968276 RepID=A0A6L9LF27_9BACT|nr:2-amino-4-hydroxy-6-hydroxymethyldihydropteridine diphosphokinase [Spirosoma terrae]NDU97952.1 2-amino-4-hydroxy-6-hydroxymethyldihydropteridine diphosphokinase [Spirosoma terrae]
MLILLLGANLGDRVDTLRKAVSLIKERIGSIDQQSSLYKTAAWGVTEQPDFLNQVVRIDTDLTPESVLEQTQRIEQELGRIRREKWGARAIDIDILYYDQRIILTETLTIPHPYLHQRRFTLVPLAEVAPDFVHPVLQKTTLELLAGCEDTGEVEIFNL